MARSPRPTVIRRALLWWFRWPSNPYVTVNFAVDFSAARAYLAGLGEPRVPVNALVAATIARVLTEFPAANARVVGRRILPCEHVGVAMPVNLIGHGAGARRELGMALVEQAETRSLREIAEVGRGVVHAEREGRGKNPFVRGLMGLAEAAPDPVVGGMLRVIDGMSRRPRLARRVYEQFPLTTALSNAGAALGDAPGMWFRGADVPIPQRLAHIGTFWGVSALQDEVVPVDGAPAVRPVLPVVLLFDHRLVDGVAGGRLATRFGAILRDPAAVFGADGRTRPARVAPAV